MKTILDANVILRYLLNDNIEMADLASEKIKEGAYTIPEVMAEVVYVLNGVYHVERTVISDTLTQLLSEIYMDAPDIMLRTLQLYKKTTLDFVDCILIARHQILGDSIISFDKKLNRNMDLE